MTVRIVSDQHNMERFVGSKLDDADATFQMMKDRGLDVTSFVSEGKQWQAVTVTAAHLSSIPSLKQ